MEKGDCFILKNDDVYFAIILHHSTFVDGELFHGFIVIGDHYSVSPTLKEIESGKILGYKFIDETSDLMNSLAWMGKGQNASELYNGVKYDVLTITEALFTEESNRIQRIGRVNLHEEFFPRPEFHSRVSNYKKLVEVISERISKRASSKVEWNRFYDAFKLDEVLKKADNTI